MKSSGGHTLQFKVGDKVVYPNQGIGEIRGITSHTVMGNAEDFYSLHILANDSTVMIPVNNVDNVGLRRLSSDGDLKKLFDVLESESYEAGQDWKHRYKDNVEKMSSGCIIEVGVVLQNLYFLSFQKPLSFREKKMYDRARRLVISEISTVQQETEGSVEKLVESMLSTAYEKHTAQAVG